MGDTAFNHQAMTSPSNRNKLSQLAASRLGARLWRMSVGLFWTGNAIKFDKPDLISVRPGDVLIRNARPVKSGVEGMSDGIGFISKIITVDMVGKPIAQYLAIEDKTGSGRATKEQSAFIQMVRRAGGLAGVARSDEDVRRICEGEQVD